MWMFVKVIVAMSAVAGVATVPTVLLSHDSQTHTSGAVSAMASTNTHTSSATKADGSSHIASTSTNQTSAGTVTVHSNGANVQDGVHGNSSVITKWSLPPFPIPPVPVDPVPLPPTKPVQPPVQPPTQPPVKSENHPSTTAWGKITSVGGGSITLLIKGQSSTATFTLDGNTVIDSVGGPMRPLDETSTASLSRLHAGDNVMLVAKDNHATLIVDRGGITGPYLPLGGGTVQGGMTAGSVQGGGAQSGVTTQTSGAMQVGSAGN
jgi:hypothetical protein